MKTIIPKGFLWKLTFLNVFVIILTISVSSWALYQTACVLVEGMGTLEGVRQQQFNATLLQYLWMFSLIGIVVGSVFHFYFTKRIIRPIRKLIESTKQLKKGEYPHVIQTHSQDEIGELVEQYNGLIQQLQANESHRQQHVADLAHEFRTPLANLNGYLHALKNDVITGDRELYHSLYEESKRLTSMIKQLEQLKEWDFTTSHVILPKVEVNIAEEINQCASMFEWKLLEVDIPVEINATSQRVHVYEEGIRQVLSNLIDNAIRYYTGQDRIIIKGESLQDMYRISVSGPSHMILENEKESIFERFHRLDDSRSRETGGTGLGLAIAQTIVKQHGGEIGVIPTKDCNTFWFTISYGR